MTRTTPLRRTILQFSQIRRTLARTFMALNLLRQGKTGESTFITESLVRLKTLRSFPTDETTIPLPEPAWAASGKGNE
jgi:hypothetical protein